MTRGSWDGIQIPFSSSTFLHILFPIDHIPVPSVKFKTQYCIQLLSLELVLPYIYALLYVQHVAPFGEYLAMGIRC
jgi:hypothetical protein